MGRPRKKADRYPSGQVRPETAPTQIRRMLDYATKLGADPRLGYELGRLLVRGKITSTEYANAERYGELVGRYDRAKGFLPPARPVGCGYEVGYGRSSGYGLDPSEDERKAIAKIEIAMNAADACMSRPERRAMLAVAVEDRPLRDHEDAVHFRRACEQLARHFGAA